MKKIMKSLFTATVLTVMLFAMGVMVSAAESALNVPALYYGNESGVTKSYSYTNNAVIDEYECGIVIPLKVSAPGTIKLNINYTRLEKNVYAYVYTDAACTNKLSIYAGASIGDTSKEGYIPVSNAGTYYLKFYSSYYSFDESVYTNSFTVTASQYTKTDKTIKSGQTINYYRLNGSDNVYFKYKAEKTGTVTVVTPYKYGSYVTLTNSKKKALSDEEWVSSYSNNKFVFAVKKGVTYHFLVKSNGTSGGNIQSFSVKNKAVKAKGGTSKKKAATIKYNKTIKGLITPGDKKAKWYKVAVKKGKKPAFVLNGNITGSLKITIYKKSGKKMTVNRWNGGNGKYTSYGTWTKGTYYIKVSRANAKSSGSFSIKNKQVKN